MRVLPAHERRGLTAASAVLIGAIALAAVLVIEGRGLQRLLPVLACIVALSAWTTQLTRWRNLIAGLLLVILFIPIGRYSLPGNLPFKLEPYRLVVAALALLWVLSMLADHRVKLRRSGLDAPLLLILLTTFLSDVVNPDRVGPMSSDVLKGQTFFVSFFIVLYLVVSLVRTRTDLLFFVKLLATAGAVVATFAVIERRTGYNVFNHLRTIFPLLHFEGAGEQFRSGRLRVLASSQHPIALSVLFVVLLPLVLYLARREGRRWLFVAGLYVIAIFTTGSRTGIIGLLVLSITYLFLQPRAVLRRWPLAVPMLAAVHVAAPGALGTIRATMTPSGMLAEQSAITVGNDAYGSGRLTDIGPTLGEWSNKPLLGVGFATRITVGPNANARLLDNQWAGTLLEVGYLGFLPWIWLFGRSVRRLARASSAEGDDDDSWLLTGFAAGIAAFAVTMFFYDTFSFIQNVFMCFIVLGLSAAFLNIRANEAAVITNERTPPLPTSRLTRVSATGADRS
jgi:hypothetical protein